MKLLVSQDRNARQSNFALNNQHQMRWPMFTHRANHVWSTQHEKSKYANNRNCAYWSNIDRCGFPNI